MMANTLSIGACFFMGKKIDLTGQKFNMLTVIKELGVVKSGRSNNVVWLCQCECGNETQVQTRILKSGGVKSCGCLAKINHPKTHNMSFTPEYACLKGIKSRCHNPKNKKWHLYGGRGIKVCERWLGKDGLVNFVADMGLRPSPDHSIDRIDTNGHYEPNNCRWATTKVQNRNKRNNNYLEYKGEVKTLTDWAEQFGISRNTVTGRLNSGWTVEQALELPVGSLVFR